MDSYRLYRQREKQTDFRQTDRQLQTSQTVITDMIDRQIVPVQTDRQIEKQSWQLRQTVDRTATDRQPDRQTDRVGVLLY